ncbi:MAG TPA: 50S ribosomal protein L10 [Phycisphaerales bacterium]|nr:50S ribosomal protein L10 [Phycisphaerales bacterium]
MSKQVKELIMREYQARIQGANDGMLISIRGMTAIDTNKVRAHLRPKGIRVTVIRNSLARKAFEGTGLDGLAPLLEGPNALAYGGASVVEVAREIVKLLETFPGLELRGAVLDGQLFQGDAGVKALSKFPTREEAVAQVITLLVSPARKLAAQVKGPGATIAGLIKAIETKLEGGGTIARTA